MTNSEYIQKTLSMFGIVQDTIDVMLLDSRLNGDSYCETEACKKAILKDFHLVRVAAHRNVSEGGFSLSWNDCEKALKSLEKSLADDVEDDPKRMGGYGCIDRSNMW